MRLYLIRHGETVDNVAGVYAGSKDSALTIHGIQQARLLGQHFSKTRPKLSHIFSSPLQRAFKTADAIRAAQNNDANQEDGKATGDKDEPHMIITSVPQLVEQDFGFYEGKSFYARPRDSSKTGREAHYEDHRHEPGFVDVESKESLIARCDSFLQEHLRPLLDYDGVSEELSIAVVSHGILLSNLWRSLLRRLPRRSLTIAPDIMALKAQLVLEHLGGWSNTGFLELSIRHEVLEYQPLRDGIASVRESPIEGEADNQSVPEGVVNPIADPDAAAVLPDNQESVFESPADQARALAAEGQRMVTAALNIDNSSTDQAVGEANTMTFTGWSTHIMTINGQEHLRGLKRTRGGIGKSRYDESQKTMDNFFKRAKKS